MTLAKQKRFGLSCLVILSTIVSIQSFSPKSFTPFNNNNKNKNSNKNHNDQTNPIGRRTYGEIKSTKMASNDSAASNTNPTNDSRRGWIKKIAGGAVVTGIVGNKIAIRGPTPYQPPLDTMKGKVVVITGGNTGLGLESAKRLAKAGATIVVTSRNKAKGDLAVQDVKDYCAEDGVTNDEIYTLPLDLCDLESVKNFPSVFQKSPVGDRKIDVLLNNAGVMAVPELELTKDGYEKTFQSNHLGHFALTASLMPLLNLNGSDGAKVINVSSMAYNIAGKGLNLDNLNGEQSYGPWDSYGQSKLQNILFTSELNQRAKDSKINLTATSLHPGAVRTDLARYLVGPDFVSMQDKEAQKKKSFQLSPQVLALLPLVYFTKSVERGATTQIWLASGQGGKDSGGKFFFNCKEFNLQPFAQDKDAAKKLWDVSEKLSGIKYNF